MNNLRKKIIKPFLEDIWGDRNKCISPTHDRYGCTCYFDYISSYLEKALGGQESNFEWSLDESKKVNKKKLVEVVLEDILDENIEEKAEQLITMYKNYKK